MDKSGSLSANDLNAFTNIMRGALYAEQIELQRAGGGCGDSSINMGVSTDLSKETKAKLDKIAKLLGGAGVEPKEEQDDRRKKS